MRPENLESEEKKEEATNLRLKVEDLEKQVAEKRAENVKKSFNIFWEAINQQATSPPSCFHASSAAGVR